MINLIMIELTQMIVHLAFIVGQKRNCLITESNAFDIVPIVKHNHYPLSKFLISYPIYIMKKIKCVMCKHQQEVEWKTTSQSGDGRYEVHEQQIACEEC